MAFPKRQLAAEPFSDQQRAVTMSLSQRPPAPASKMTGSRGYRGLSVASGALGGGYGGAHPTTGVPPAARVDMVRGWGSASASSPVPSTTVTFSAPRGQSPAPAAAAFAGATTTGSKERFDPFKPFESFATPSASPTSASFDRRASIWNSPVNGENRVW